MFRSRAPSRPRCWGAGSQGSHRCTPTASPGSCRKGWGDCESLLQAGVQVLREAAL